MSRSVTSAAAASEPPEKLVREAVADVAGLHIGKLQILYRQDAPAAVAELARLRRGVGKKAYEDFDGGGSAALEELAERIGELEKEAREADSEDRARHFSVSLERAEDTLYLTLTLWALHQQSVRDQNMHVPGRELGRAVRELAGARAGDDASREISEPLRKRFVRVGTATSVDMLALRLRELILLMRNERIPLDYRGLADQLYAWQDIRQQARVRRDWGRSFHRGLPPADGAEPTDDTEPDDSFPSLDPGE
jgi:CRISPR system Cascade subunit CasB